MKLKEKLAEEYVDPLSADFESMPYSIHVLNLLEKAYLAGFEKAREMAYHLAIEKGSDSGALWDTDEVTKIGEEEVE